MKRRYNFDINVASADSLAGIGFSIEEFMRELGAGESVDINVSIGSAAPIPNTHAIGFAIYNEEDVEMEDDE